MSHEDEHRYPEDLESTVRRMRDERPEATAFELDRMKQRAMARASSPRSKGLNVKSRITVALLALGLMAGGTGGVLAAAGGTPGSNNKNASGAEYRTGLGCGDKNHTHTGPPGNPSKTPANSCPKGSAQNR